MELRDKKVQIGAACTEEKIYRHSDVKRVVLSTGRATESTNLDPCKLPETEPPSKENTWAGPSAPAPIHSRCTAWSSCESANNWSWDCQ